MNWKQAVRVLGRDFVLDKQMVNNLIIEADANVKECTQGRSLSRMKYDYCYRHLRDYLTGKKGA